MAWWVPAGVVVPLLFLGGLRRAEGEVGEDLPLVEEGAEEFLLVGVEAGELLPQVEVEGVEFHQEVEVAEE